MARSFVSQFTDAQLIAMKPGNRLDIAGDWKIWVFTHPVVDPSLHAPWHEAGVERGSRAHIEAREPIMVAGLNAMMALEIIDGFISLVVPNQWRPQDALYTFPTDQELADECAARGI